MEKQLRKNLKIPANIPKALEDDFLKCYELALKFRSRKKNEASSKRKKTLFIPAIIGMGDLCFLAYSLKSIPKEWRVTLLIASKNLYHAKKLFPDFEIIEFLDKYRPKEAKKDLFELLSSHSFSTVFDVTGSYLSKCLCHSLAAEKNWVIDIRESGFEEWFDRNIKWNSGLNSYEIFSLVKELWNEKPEQSEFLAPDIKSPAKILNVGLAAGSSWELKKWPDKKFSELNKKLKEKGISTFFLGYEKELFTNKEDITLYQNADDLWQSFKEKKLDLVIGNDTGYIHLAFLFNIPTLCLFGPTDPKRFSPPFLASYISSKPENGYSDWGLNSKSNREAMTKISVESVLDLLTEIENDPLKSHKKNL